MRDRTKDIVAEKLARRKGLELQRLTEKHLAAIPEYVICYGDESGRGHKVSKIGDLWWIVRKGWLCGEHKAEGKAEQAARMATWHRIRDGY